MDSETIAEKKGTDIEFVKRIIAIQHIPALLLLLLMSLGISLVQNMPITNNLPGAALAAPVGVSPPCTHPGWFPDEFGLKDHTVFWHDGYYYLASIYIPRENRFAYGRSADLCSWEDLSPILSQRIPGTWDEMAVWSPFVYEEGGVYYMYYTGVTSDFTQSIMLATSTNPADPTSWQPRGMIFQPHHAGMIWQNGQWANCRDPMLLKVVDTYYLYYTGLDQDGGIVGIATSSSPLGPWYDWGAILTLTTPNAMAESVTVALHDTFYYLFYNDTSQGQRYRIGATPSGPWTEAQPFRPGWAHEVWLGQDGYTYTSFLTNYTVTISRLTWDDFYYPPHPFIGEAVYHVLLPLILQ